VGRNSKFYDKNEKYKSIQDRNFDYGLFVMRGFTTSVTICPESIYLMIDYSSKVLCKESVLEKICSFRNEGETRDYLIGRSVMATYGNNMLYKVMDIDFSMNPNSTFTAKDGQTISFAKYFQVKYNCWIRDQNQPLVYTMLKKTKQPIYLLPELLRMTGLTEEQRQDRQLMKALAEYTKLNPQERINKCNYLS